MTDDNKNDNKMIQMESSNLPQFWHSNPKLWFKQCELIMSSARYTTDETKFNHIIKHLSESQCGLISDVILNPPDKDKYQHLKDTLIKRSEESEMRRLQSVLNTVEMGNQSPSSFHRNLTRMAGESSALTADFIKQLWISRLPSTIGAILIGMEDNEINKLYDAADKIWGMSNPYNNPFLPKSSISAVSGNTQTETQGQTSSFSINELCQQISELKEKFNKFEKNHYNRSRSKSRDRSGPRHRSKSRDKNFQFCWYHHKFGKEARKCGNPNECKFKSENSKN